MMSAKSPEQKAIYRNYNQAKGKTDEEIMWHNQHKLKPRSLKAMDHAAEKLVRDAEKEWGL